MSPVPPMITIFMACSSENGCGGGHPAFGAPGRFRRAPEERQQLASRNPLITIESQSPGARRGFFSALMEPIGEFVFAAFCISDLHPETNSAVMT